MGDLAAKPRRKSASNLRYRFPPVGRNDTPVIVIDHQRDLELVRLSQIVTKNGMAYMGSDLVKVVEIYLDGTFITKGYTVDRKHQTEDKREIMPTDSTIRAARTKDVIDIGRFEQAAVALMTQVDAAKAAPEDREREEAVFRSYQGILEWRSALQKQIEGVDSTIDVVAAKIRGLVQ